MYKVKFPGRSDQSNEHLVNFSLPFPCEVHMNYPRFKKWEKPLDFINKKIFRVLTHYTEAKPLKAGKDYLIKFSKYFDLILTNDEELFNIKNVYPKICLFGGHVPSLSPSNPVYPKYFSISNLYSAGSTSFLKFADQQEFEGYEIRKLIWKKKGQITIPKKFYTSLLREPNVPDINPYNYELKDKLMESMFSVVIENTFEDNWFTEKLIDCFRNYTLPIYFGCKNIGNFFDKRGIIIPSSVDDAIKKINLLNEESYYLLSKYIIKNFLIANQYVSHTDLMTKYIIEGKSWLESKFI